MKGVVKRLPLNYYPKQNKFAYLCRRIQKYGWQHQYRARNPSGITATRTHHCMAEPAIGYKSHDLLPHLWLLQHRHAVVAPNFHSVGPRLFQALFWKPWWGVWQGALNKNFFLCFGQVLCLWACCIMYVLRASLFPFKNMYHICCIFVLFLLYDIFLYKSTIAYFCIMN